MHQLVRSTILAAFIAAPATAMAFTWPLPFPQPSIPEDEARSIAMDHGFASVRDIDSTIDGDWKIKGEDTFGSKLYLVIDGKTGEVEHAEMDSK